MKWTANEHPDGKMPVISGTAGAYYNEIEKYPAQWLRNLIEKGHIAAGHVDERDIREVNPIDLTEYRQAHFFAGIGVWSYALRLAGWPDELEVWTGSCPCQPFSTAGNQRGTNDPRHLWPEWLRLIRECRPTVIFGEQVASKDGLKWLDIVQTDLEGAGYAVGAVDLCAAGAKVPHIRQRLYFVAHTDVGFSERTKKKICARRNFAEHGSRLDDTEIIGEKRLPIRSRRSRKDKTDFKWGSEIDNRMAHTSGKRFQKRNEETNLETRTFQESERLCSSDFWDNIEWIPCTDGKFRPTEPGLFPLVNGSPQRVGRLCAYGNAIVAPLAAEFIRAYMEVING